MMKTGRAFTVAAGVLLGLLASFASGEVGDTAFVNGFTAYGGEWAVSDGVLTVGGGPGPKLVFDGPAFTEGEVGVDVLFPDRSGGNAGLIVKVSGPGIGADRFNGYEISLDARNQYLRLGRHRQNFELIKDTPCDVPVNEWVSLVVRFRKTRLEVLVNGGSIVTYEDRAHPLVSGTFGLRPWQRVARFRRLWARRGDTRTEIPFVAASWPETLKTDDLPPVAVITRHPLGRPNAISCDIWQAKPRAPGCSIRIIDPGAPDTPAKTIFSDRDGCIYDMNVSYDARTLYFSYRHGSEKYWRIWRINVDGTGLEQLTDGPHYDVGPCLMPNGRIVFVSTRRFGYTVCQPGPSSNLHIMDADGSNVRCVSMNTLSDFSPQMLPDGRVLFTRWEYIDRDLTYRQSLWTQNPDGTAYRLFFGNTIRDVGTFWQARPLPGSCERLVATFAPHHHWPHGAIGLIDRRYGVEGGRGKGFVYVTKEFPSIGDRGNEWSYRDPFPLDDGRFLCSYGGKKPHRFRVYLLDLHGRKRMLYEDSEMGCYFPVPLRPVDAPRNIPSRPPASGWNAPTSTVDNAMGTFLLVDAYKGIEETIGRGRAKILRVMEQVRKSEDLRGRAYDESPVMGYGTYYAKRCWGTVPLEEDGSAHFKAPALRELYFQLLDAEGRELQRMTSGVQLMPGETIGCIGCHEARDSAVPAAQEAPLAVRNPPRALAPPEWGNDGIVDFVKLVQPVLDKYCVKCHSGADPKAGYDFSGDKTRFFNMAYDNLLGRSRSYRQHNMLTGEMLPGERAKGKPLVHFYWLLRTPSAVNQPLWTGSHASRLTDIIESDHCKKAIPLEERRRIYMWIDANVPYYGTYANSRPSSSGKRDLCTHPKTGQRASDWFARDFSDVYRRRCHECHGNLPHPNDKGGIWTGKLAWINFSNPERSPALTAHLPRGKGGRGIAGVKDGVRKTVFKDKDDPDYRKMLQAIEVGKELANDAPRADMPGFPGHRAEP